MDLETASKPSALRSRLPRGPAMELDRWVAVAPDLLGMLGGYIGGAEGPTWPRGLPLHPPPCGREASQRLFPLLSACPR